MMPSRRLNSLVIKVLKNSIDAMFPIIERFGQFADKYAEDKNAPYARELLAVLADARKLVWKMQDLSSMMSAVEHH
jgi:hypothetical protein